MSRQITASEVLRRLNGPWTKEELVEREARNRAFNEKASELFIGPIILRLLAVLKKSK